MDLLDVDSNELIWCCFEGGQSLYWILLGSSTPFWHESASVWTWRTGFIHRHTKSATLCCSAKAKWSHQACTTCQGIMSLLISIQIILFLVCITSCVGLFHSQMMGVVHFSHHVSAVMTKIDAWMLHVLLSHSIMFFWTIYKGLGHGLWCVQ